MDEKPTVTSVRLPESIDKKIAALHQKEKRSKSAVLRLLIEEALKAREVNK